MKDDSHIALYRKYRPKGFDAVRGQDHVVKALEGAIKKKAIPHAFLFAGPRGTGKTSVARIFASAIGTKPIDIYEMDAASNRGIDEVRELREAVLTLPYESERKVYIIDEVHMLTKDAFNAFLKTLEEPPKHVVFILATTEPEKLLETIISRCQVFYFKSPVRAELRDAVLEVTKAEKFKLTSDAADLIAIAADGSYRDAYSITEKVMMASPDTGADADEAALIIGAPKGTLLMDLVDALHTKNVQKGLEVLETALAQNLDMKLFARLLLERIRAVLLMRHAKADAEKYKSQLREEDFAMLQTISKDAKSPVNSAMLVRLLEAADLTGRTSIATLPLELAVIELCGN